MDEKWIRISDALPDIASYYFISSHGRVYSEYSKRILATSITETGYVTVNLSMKDHRRVTKRLNRLVMIVFCYFVGCEEYEVNHIDGNKLNNYLYNLEWVTSKENNDHAILTGLKWNTFIGEINPHAKITEADVYRIYELLISNQYTDIQIAEMLSVTPTIVRLIANGETWRHLFTDEQRTQMASTRYGHIIDDQQMHSICRYFQNNIHRFSGYGAVTALVKEALISNGLVINDSTIRKAKRLYYRRENPDITSLYNY